MLTPLDKNKNTLRCLAPPPPKNVGQQIYWYSGLHNKKGYCSPGTKKNACRPLLVLSLVWQGGPSPTFDQTTSSSVSLISKRAAHHDGQRLWLMSLPVALPPPIRFMPLHPHTMGGAPQPRFCWNQRWGQALPTIPPSPFRQIYA